ncbi:hypothetical protein U9M48_014496 [Paspalum notatum var. saurae]|uniref:Fe2OG dioxygenase domain-containing protein n=1 Tax=Paspalum notatum var. saurae TaxID=547442 RepID=A0AAQ3T2S4_PASNO
MAAAAPRRLDLPVVDLASPDLRAAAKSIREACVEYGFFYVVNHGIERGLLERVFAESRSFFQRPMEEKMALRKNSSHRGYTAPFSEKVDDSPASRGDSKETFYIGPMGDENLQSDVNQWPSEELFPSWKNTMQSYHANALATGKRILSLIALSLDLDADFFEKNGAFEIPSAFLRLLHYPGDVNGSKDEDIIEKKIGILRSGKTSLIINIGDLLERWTNCVFRSTLHRVITVGKERYSVAFFIDPSPNLVVKCMESCCSEAYPARFPPIKSGDYLEERLSSTYKLATS